MRDSEVSILPESALRPLVCCDTEGYVFLQISALLIDTRFMRI
jgi:hypothetical protein